jgi:hypothetical protein
VLKGTTAPVGSGPGGPASRGGLGGIVLLSAVPDAASPLLLPPLLVLPASTPSALVERGT